MFIMRVFLNENQLSKWVEETVKPFGAFQSRQQSGKSDIFSKFAALQNVFHLNA